jgi:DNA-binding NtrC family response regulator
MSLSAQAKVLRALQEGRVTRVGGDKDIAVDVRVIAATNKNLKEEIAENRFREDLYHRLGVIIIHVPALKERTDDIPMLAAHFISQVCSEMGMPSKSIEDEAIKQLQALPWTGNIREFRNVIERLIILGGQSITAEDVKVFA